MHMITRGIGDLLPPFPRPSLRRTLAFAFSIALSTAQAMHTNGMQAAGSSPLCLDASNQGVTPGTKVITWTCNGGSNQQWSLS